jgi:hypothetical protein
MYSDKKYSPAKGSVDRMWPNMKIKSLSLLLVFTGIIIISGCVNAGAQPPGSKAPENLYRSIFYPYAGLLDQRHSGDFLISSGIAKFTINFTNIDCNQSKTQKIIKSLTL